MTTTYRPQGITRPRRKGPHPGVVKSWKGRPVQGRHRQITLRVDAKQYQDWLRASGAIEYRDSRLWLVFLADREAEASLNPPKKPQHQGTEGAQPHGFAKSLIP